MKNELINYNELTLNEIKELRKDINKVFEKLQAVLLGLQKEVNENSEKCIYDNGELIEIVNHGRSFKREKNEWKRKRNRGIWTFMISNKEREKLKNYIKRTEGKEIKKMLEKIIKERNEKK